MIASLPAPEKAIELQSEELALFVLRYLARQERLNLNNFLLSLREYAPTQKEEVSEAFTEAWIWLERELMLAPLRGNRDWLYITKRGKTLLEHSELEAYLRADLLQAMVLAPVLARKVRPTYMRGDYDTVIFQAFKEVEVRVREAARFGNDKFGVSLMREAFNPSDGPLSDQAIEPGERQAMSDLFAGAIGFLKNPTSHRDTVLSEPQEAAEAILFANNLLRMLERLTASGRDGAT